MEFKQYHSYSLSTIEKASKPPKMVAGGVQRLNPHDWSYSRIFSDENWLKFLRCFLCQKIMKIILLCKHKGYKSLSTSAFQPSKIERKTVVLNVMILKHFISRCSLLSNFSQPVKTRYVMQFTILVSLPNVNIFNF